MAESRIDELRRRLERDPGSRLFAQLAEELRKAGEFEEAIGVARAGLAQHPTYPSARLTLGRALLDSGDPRAARVELDAAVKGAPDNILANRMLGEALESLGDLRSALAQYRATLGVAPGDQNLEAKVVAIEAQLKTGAADSGAGAGGGAAASGATAPVAGVPPLPPSARRPAAAAEPAGAEGGDEGSEVAPTIRIRARGEPPLPPATPGPGAAPGREATAPIDRAVAGPRDPGGRVSSPVEAPAAPAAAAEGTEPTAREEPPRSRESGGVRVGGPVADAEGAGGPGKLPGAGSRGAGPDWPAETTLPPGARPGEKRGEAGPGPTAEAGAGAVGEEARPGGDRPPDVGATEDATEAAPTLPPSEHRFDEPEEVLAPTLPPRSGGDVPGGASEEGDRTSLFRSEPWTSGAVEAGGISPEPMEAEPLQAEPRREPRQDEPRVEPVPAEEAGPGPEGRLPGEEAAPTVSARETRSEAVESGPPASPLSSVTLAELYFQQGLLERAAEVYRQVLDEEPGNARARLRLDEVEALVSAGASELSVPAPSADVGREARRRALERTIERLEGLLAVVRRR